MHLLLKKSQQKGQMVKSNFPKTHIFYISETEVGLVASGAIFVAFFFFFRKVPKAMVCLRILIFGDIW